MFRLMSDQAFRVTMTLYAITFLAIGVIHVRTRARINNELGHLRQSIVLLNTTLLNRTTALDVRLAALDREVFGAPPPPPPAQAQAPSVTVGESWRQNRDGELRRRITALEEWRLRTER